MPNRVCMDCGGGFEFFHGRGHEEVCCRCHLATQTTDEFARAEILVCLGCVVPFTFYANYDHVF